ncbi:MAG: fructosamine kinase family protein [Sideroxydans sp.]
MASLAAIADAITRATGQPFRLARQQAVGGGDINQSFLLHGTDDRSFFLKLNAAAQAALFVAEVEGLAALAATRTLRVPAVIAQGVCDDGSYLVLEYLPLAGEGDAAALGRQLAALHRHSVSRFGFAHDNFIGSTPQPNGWCADWIEFWRERRLGYQLELAQRDGHGGVLQRLGQELQARLPEWFEDYAPLPSLLHGDLWGGNHAFLDDGTPVLFDPAAYYGDRECDLAMTELFGGYPPAFYAAYRAAWPLHPGYARRKTLYNLYHILNHAHLFGGAYVRQAQSMMQALLG